jgi:hypothetical protein
MRHLAVTTASPGQRPRGVDFGSFHQSPEAENCYGPFRGAHLTAGGRPWWHLFRWSGTAARR